MLTISELVAELDNCNSEEGRYPDHEIWGLPGQATCDFCLKGKSADHSIKREEVCFCDECGYNLVMFLIEHGYSDKTYNEYINYLINEYTNRITNLRQHCQSLY